MAHENNLASLINRLESVAVRLEKYAATAVPNSSSIQSKHLK